MKCGRKIVYRTYKRRGKRAGETYEKPVACISWDQEIEGLVAKKLMKKGDRLEVCDGKIVASVGLSTEYGGCCCCGSTEIEVEYECDKCGNKRFLELPQFSDLVSELLTKYINKTAAKHFDPAIEEYKARKEEIDKFWAEYKKKRQKRKRG